MRSSDSVLILHNAPSPCGPHGAPFQESEAGVLKEVDAVREALVRLGIPSRCHGVRRMEEVSGALAAAGECVVFNLVESLDDGPFDACFVPAVCRAHAKAATGSGARCLMLAQDKWLANRLIEAAGAACPEDIIVLPGSDVPADRLSGKRWIVKPAHSDASEGIGAASVIEADRSALREAVRRIHDDFGQPALVEEFVGQRELNVSLIERNGKLDVLPIAEIDFGAFPADRPRIVGYEAKWRPDSFEFANTPRIIPAPLTAVQAEQIEASAVTAWRALGCRDYARVDFRLDASGKVFVLEVNPNPDISPDAGFAAALNAAGIPFESFVAALVANASARAGHAATTHTGPDPLVRIREMTAADIPAILSLLEASGAFRPAEVSVAREVLCHAAAGFGVGPYASFVADCRGQILGWVCHSETACTEGTFDIHWLAVAPACQGHGIGMQLALSAIGDIAQRGGRLVLVETSGRPDYSGTRAFYEKLGFREMSRVAHFYAAGDDKVVYGIAAPAEYLGERCVTDGRDSHVA